MLRVQCPCCGHGKMHFGEPAELRDETRRDVFSCRGCGSVYDAEDMEEATEGDELESAEVRSALTGEGPTL